MTKLLATIQPAIAGHGFGARHTNVVVVGGGFGGYYAARALCRKLARTNATVTLVSDTDGLVYQPLLPDVAVGAVDPRNVVVPYTKTLRRAELVRGHVYGVDISQRTVAVRTPHRDVVVPYDYLLLAPGGVTRLFDIPGLADRAVGFKTPAEALYLRELVLTQMELANGEKDAQARRSRLAFVVVGAGYAGTELVAQMARLTQQLLPRFQNVRPQELSWTLVDHADKVMPELGTELGVAALQLLRRRGVDVRLGTSLSQISETHVELSDGSQIEIGTVVWCAGVAANPLTAALGLPLFRGRLVVREDLQVPGHPEIFAIGDAAAVPDVRGTRGATNKSTPVDSTTSSKICPPTAQHAMRQGPAAAHNIVASIRGTSLAPYRHRDLGLVVDLGGRAAVAKPLGLRLRGLPAKCVTRAYHLYALPTLRRRLRVSLDWALAGRGADDVSFGLIPLRNALAAGEHGEPASNDSVLAPDATEP